MPPHFPKWNPWNTLQDIALLNTDKCDSSTTIRKKLEKLSFLVLPQLPPVRQEQAAPPNISQSIKEDTIGRPPSLRGGLHALFHRQTQMKREATQRHRKERHRDINTILFREGEIVNLSFPTASPFYRDKMKNEFEPRHTGIQHFYVSFNQSVTFSSKGC